MFFMLPESIKIHCEDTLDLKIARITALSGGDINQARILHTSKGAFFIKFNSSDQAFEMLRTEKKGLELIAASESIRVPVVLGLGNTSAGAYLLLEYLPNGGASNAFWQSFGRQLARMHRSRQSHYGLDHDNFIGHLPQFNTPQKDAVSFLIEDRLEPQCRMAIEQQLMQPADMRQAEVLFRKLPHLIPSELPSLIHGDLWNGNFMVSENQKAILIDPAAAYGLREMDLAMSLLFGGFDPLFYKAYQEAYPMQSDWEKRMDIYQLYYLLAHLNMFGRSYLRSVQNILGKYQ